MNKYIFIITAIITASLKVVSQTIQLVDTNWFRHGPYCADVKSLAMAPSNPNVLYLGTYASGVYKTTNGGETWTFCSTENLPVYEDSLANSPSLPCWWFGDYYPIEAIEVHPQDENHLWISTLERGLFESINGGYSWQKANESLPDTLAVNLIHINQQNPDDILLGTGKYFTSGSPQNGGLYRTLNGGNSWSLVNSLPHGGTYSISDITRDPTNNEHIITAISSAGEPGFSWGLMESYDNGITWQELSSNMYDFKNISINPANNQNLWGVAYTGYQDYWLLSSNNGGHNWSLYEGFADPYKWVTDLYADTDFNLYIDKETEGPGYSYDYSIFKSTDNGGTWFELDIPKRSGNALKNRCQAEPSNTDNVYFGSYYGVYHSVDGGAITQLKNSELMNSYIAELEMHPTKSGVLYAGGRQGLWKSYDGGHNWQQIMDQAIICIKYDAIHPDTLYMGGGPLFLRSYDEGDTFDTIYNGISGFIASLAVNPQKSNIVYVVTGVDDTVFLIYKSTDYGDNWQLLFVVNEDESNTDFIIDPLHPDTLYFGNYRSLDGGNTWEDVFDNTILAVHPHNSQILYATNEVYLGGTTLEVSYDWGVTFETIAQYHNGPFPGDNIYCFRFDKENPDYMFYSTRNTNVYYSLDAGASWQQLPGNYNKRVTDIIPYVNENKFYLATHGDGVWVYDTTTTSIIENNHIMNNAKVLLVSPNPFLTNITINFTIMNSGVTNLSVYNLNGSLIKTLINEHKTKGKYKTIWNGKDQTEGGVIPGLYLIRLQTGRNIYTSKAVLLK